MVVPKKIDVNILVDSYGGSPTEAYNISTKLLRESKKYDVPYNTFTNNGAFSGGMFILCTGQKAFVASPFTDAGSIGVVGGYCQLTDYGRKKSHVRHHIVTSGDKKRSSLDDFHEKTSKKDEAEYQVRLKETHELFKDFVREHRPENTLKGDEGKMFSGMSFSAKRALELGLIDDICNHEEYVQQTYGDHVISYEMSVTDPSINAAAMLEKLTGGPDVSAPQVDIDSQTQVSRGFQISMKMPQRFKPILARK
jgi:serine protease SohB